MAAGERVAMKGLLTDGYGSCQRLLPPPSVLNIIRLTFLSLHLSAQRQVARVSFSMMSAAEIQRLSHVEVVNSDLFQMPARTPLDHGPLDKRMVSELPGSLHILGSVTQHPSTTTESYIERLGSAGAQQIRASSLCPGVAAHLALRLTTSFHISGSIGHVNTMHNVRAGKQGLCWTLWAHHLRAPSVSPRLPQGHYQHPSQDMQALRPCHDAE